MLTSNAATVSPAMTRFYLPKGRVTPDMTGVVALQKRTDLSGKFARKVGRVRRALSLIEDAVVKETNDLQEQFKRRDDAGDVIPVVLVNGLGQVVFEKDGDGKDTDRPVIIPNQFYVTDQAAYDREKKAMLDEVVVVDCECFTEAEIDAFKAIGGEIVDAMMDLMEGSEYTIAPEPAEETDQTIECTAAEERTAP